MKERPIIFNTEMVKAYQAGRKTMTRRVIKPQPVDWDDGSLSWRHSGSPNRPEIISRMISKCPHGQAGSRLWVKETSYAPPKPLKDCLGYVADGDYPHDCSYRIVPSIFMPRWASRILLEITEVRVERVQEISEDDARAEGANCTFRKDDALWEQARVLSDAKDWAAMIGSTYRFGFQLLWDSLNAKRGYGWEMNPWVRVISFKEVK